MAHSSEAHRMRLVTEGVADAADVDRFILRYLALYLDGGGDIRDPMALKAMQAGRDQAERVRSRYAQARKDTTALAEEASPLPGPRPGETEHSRRVRLVAEDSGHRVALQEATASGSEVEVEAAMAIVEADRKRKALDDRAEAARQERPNHVEYNGFGENPHARAMRLVAEKVSYDNEIESVVASATQVHTAEFPEATTLEVEEIVSLARLEYAQMVEASKALADDETDEALELLKERARAVYKRTHRMAHGLDHAR